MKRLLLLLTVFQLVISGWAQETIDQSLSRHNFFYAGESKQQRMYIVKDGQVTWQYNNPQGRGEISDAVLLTDGHVLIAHQFGIAEVTQQGQTIWQYAAPQGTEIHTIQPIGRNHVLFIQNGNPAKVVVMTIPDCQVVYEFKIPASKSVHGQFRNARLSTRGTLLVCHMSQDYVAEYSVQGNELARWDFPSPWSVAELDKEHLLITGKGLVREIDRSNGLDKFVRDIKTADYGIKSPQKSVRLKNGNLIINDWYSEWSKSPMDSLNPPVQAIEMDKQGRVVWQLCSWKDPDLGPSTTIQPLEQAVNRDRLFFGHFNGRSPKLMLGVNQPVGEGRGIHPGRVAWIHSPGVATWDGRTGLWVEDRWNNQRKADAMITEAIVQLTGEETAKKGWQALFKHFNKEHGKGNRGYKKGEMIAVKLNLNNALTHRDTIELNSSPFVTLALVRSMVLDGGIREQDLVLCEPSRAITDSIYDKVHREFPRVRFIDNIGGDGREKCEYYPERIVYSQDNGKLARGLAKCIVDADYLINSSLLKTHVGPGVTLTSKNWYGATDIALRWQKNAHNGFSQDKRNGKPAYKTFVDWMAHKHLGQKALLFIIDGTYGSRHVNGKPFPKWQKPPFNNQWCSSIIVSQDEVACDAVGMDLIISEWPEYGSLNYCDEYLIEAASLPNPPSGTVYKQDGQPLTKSLGLMEHCDKNRKYTKIDLKYVNHFQREAFQTETPMVHDPVMAKEGDTYYLYATGMGIQQMTSKDRKIWTVLPQPVMNAIPKWTTDSVPGFGAHVWAPDVIQWHGRWWMAYSCSTFGKNGSAIGLLSSRSLASKKWKDEGCIVTSHNWKVNSDGTTTGDNWNAIDPNFVIDDNDTPWLVWGSFWDGIQLARLDSTMHLASKPVTIARRHRIGDPNAAENPTSRFAGRNAIEAPFIFRHDGYYYLFVSWDYCCRGAKSNYRVAVGRSKTVNGPYLDREGKDMLMGGGTLFLEGDKKEWEAAGHCAAYTFDGEDIFICHGYSTQRNGAAMLIQRPISWTSDGWPVLKSN